MDDTDQRRRQNVEAFFGELLGVHGGPEKRSMLASASGPLKQALIANHWNKQTAFDVTSHISDWHEEAAFLVAVGLFQIDLPMMKFMQESWRCWFMRQAMFLRL